MTNYYYNEIELPDINTVWTDKDKYPYAQIAIFTNSTTENMVYLLRLLTTEGKVLSGGLVGVTSVYRYNANNPEKGWYQYNFSYGAGLVVWANYDVYYKDDVADVGGTLYLKGSDPVPVGGVPTLTERDLYRKINGQPTKLTLYKKVSGELVALDEYST